MACTLPAFLLAALLAPPLTVAGAPGLITNPNGLMGYRWGMSIKQAKQVQSIQFSCAPIGPLTVCSGETDKPTQPAAGTVLPASAAQLVLQFEADKLIGLTHDFVTPKPARVLILLHNLMGEADHRVEVDAKMDAEPTRVQAWIRPRSVIELQISGVNDAELPNTRVEIRAWSRKHYLRLHNQLPMLVPEKP